MTAPTARPGGAADRRDWLLGEMSHAHEALLALFGGVQDADVARAVVALDQIAGVGERLECEELAAWCRGDGRRSAEAGLETFVVALPQLLALWERAQDSVIARSFPVR